ncbi:MAG TPA: GtrA family protein [Kaistiaceae bacterium]|nr:GtrA family protein [Kaistiaceae bacterium]
MHIAVQFPRYVAVSAAALAVDFGVFLGLTRLGTDPTIAGALGYAAGLVLHYALSRRFVFVGRGEKSERRLFTEFALTGFVGIALTAAVITVAHDVFGFAPVTAKVAAVVVSFLAVFVMRRSVVFAEATR